MWVYVSVFLLSASTLAFELILSRLFAITQFYHFAFMAISLALLGTGASGTALSVFPALRKGEATSRLPLFALATSLAMLGSFVLANRLPFDSFAIAWDRSQILYLALMYLALAVPFFTGALTTGWLLSTHPNDTPRVYAANLIGSAVGCLLALGTLATLGGERAALFSAWLAGLASLTVRLAPSSQDRTTPPESRISFVLGLVVVSLLSWWMASLPAVTHMQLSPYKSLAQALRVPQTELVWTRWNAATRVDFVQSPAIRSFPGMSYAYTGPLPRQDGLTFDGDDLSPVTYLTPETAGFAEYLPGAVAHRLRPNATTLVLGARGGLDVVAALANGAARVTAVESNEIAVEAVHDATGELDDPRVQYVVEDSRAFVQRTVDTFDIVQLALTQPYRPVTSGAYSLAENFDLTVEGFRDLLQRLNEDGILVVTRWLQTPPSEGLRLFALVVTAAEQQGLDPSACVIALRGYNTVTVIAQRGSWTGAEIDTITDFAAARRFDLIYAPGLSAAAANRYNVLPEDPYYRNFHALISAPDRHRFYADYPFDVTPPTDDWPFFGHYFKWTQAGELWAQLGKTWQPFGGAGYYVLLFMLGFVSIAAAMLILLPLVVRGALGRRQHTGQAMAYFAVIGLGFLFVEIPLTQRLILYVERPTYALGTVLFGLLLFSGIGSTLSPRAPWRLALASVVIASTAYPFLLPVLFQATLGLPLTMRFVLAILVLGPLGLLMGMPLPKGIDWLKRSAPDLIPWAWGVNGAVSVVAAVLAALIALSAGFTWVLLAGAVCYGSAFISISRTSG